MNLNKIKIFIISFIIMMTSTAVYDSAYSATSSAGAKPAVKAQSVQTPSAYVISPLEAVKNPAKYLNKTISFNAEFVSYSALGLDYKPAYRDAANYIGILIKRDDVCDHVIPLSEMKIFIKRETAEKHTDLEAGDKVKITGTVFSNALGDPWVDVKSFTVVEKKKKDKKTTT